MSTQAICYIQVWLCLIYKPYYFYDNCKKRQKKTPPSIKLTSIHITSFPSLASCAVSFRTPPRSRPPSRLLSV